VPVIGVPFISASLDGTTTMSDFLLNYCGVLYKPVIFYVYMTLLQVIACHVHLYDDIFVNFVPNTMYTTTKCSVRAITAPCRKS